MRGVKGSFVCGQDHRSNTRHSREEVTAAIEKLKAKNPSALLPVEDVQSAVNMAMESDATDQNSDGDGEVLWNEENDGSTESDIVYMASSNMKSVEETLANNAFTHGCLTNATDTQGIEDPYLTFYCYPAHKNQLQFKGIIIETAANRRSIMSESQYHAYQEEFGRRVPMRPPKRDVKGIGGVGGVKSDR